MAACMNEVLEIRSTQRNYATDFRSHKTPNPKPQTQKDVRKKKTKKKKKTGILTVAPNISSKTLCLAYPLVQILQH
jgi:hypothetical protein